MYDKNEYLNDLLNKILNNENVFKFRGEFHDRYVNLYIFEWKYGYTFGSVYIFRDDDKKISEYSYFEIYHMTVLLMGYEHPLLDSLFKAAMDSRGIEYR